MSYSTFATFQTTPTPLNGLQLANQGEIVKIAAAVDFFLTNHRTRHRRWCQSDDRASWNVLGRVATTTRSCLLHESKHSSTTMWRYTHPILPLDKHPGVGNNTLLAAALGLVPSGEFARHKTISIGVSGESDRPHGRSLRTCTSLRPSPWWKCPSNCHRERPNNTFMGNLHRRWCIARNATRSRRARNRHVDRRRRATPHRGRSKRTRNHCDLRWSLRHGNARSTRA